MIVRTVGEVTLHVKALLDGDPLLSDLWVSGEVSNFTRAASGHWYFTVKDDEAALRCVMWRSKAAAQAQVPANGDALLVHGDVSVYAAGGQFQLYADHVEPAGLGDLHREFEALKARLAAQGLFDQERKRPLPRFPRRIGVVTSLDAAALRDVCQVLRRRWPGAEVLVSPTPVQGEAAPPRIVAALDAAGRSGADVVIVTRGGGSIEDLWAFNDEAVAHAIAACPVPVVAGVGHETDVTIADFVADVRAATPTAAAELATPDGRELRMSVDELRNRASRLAVDGVSTRRRDTASLMRRLEMSAPARRLEAQREIVAGYRARLERAAASRLRLARADLAGLTSRMEALSPAATLERGYSRVRLLADGRTVRHAAQVAAGDGLGIDVADGSFEAVVVEPGDT
jgi:exodeoxyribonuclease VII large subunit